MCEVAFWVFSSSLVKTEQDRLNDRKIHTGGGAQTHQDVENVFLQRRHLLQEKLLEK